MKILMFLFLFPSFCLGKDVIYRDYKFDIPDNYSVHDNGKPLAKGSNAIHIVNEHKKGVASIELVDKSKNFFDLDDYGTNTHRELFHILYSDEPSKNEAIIEYRRMESINYESKFTITKNDDFVFFRAYDEKTKLTTIMVSTPLDDAVIKMFFDPGEKLIQSIVDSIQVK